MNRDDTAKRRDFLAGAVAVGGGLAASALAACKDAGQSQSAQGPGTKFKWKVQTVWEPGTDGFIAFQRFCERLKQNTEGMLEIEPFAGGTLVGNLDMLDALKSAKLDAMCCFSMYWSAKVPACVFLSSYPLGMDRPDQWETWFYGLGGLETARKIWAPHDLFYVGPIQHDLNLIHSKVPINSFEDFKGKKLRMPSGLIGDVFTAAGAATVMMAGGDVYPALQKGTVDAADFVGPAVNFKLGFADVTKYIIMGPHATPCLHQPVDLLDFTVRNDRWRALPKHLQDIVVTTTREFSWEHYAFIQKENVDAWKKFAEKGTQIIRLSDADIEKFRKVAIPAWFRWAKKDPLAKEAFASQLAFMMSPSVGYVTDAMLVDESGARLSL